MAPSAPSVSLRCLPLLLRAVRDRGGDPRSLLRRFDLPPELVDTEEGRFPLALVPTLGEACARAAGDPDLGLTVARTQPRGTWGLLEYGARSAPSLSAAFELFVANPALLNERVELGFSREDDGVRLTHRIVGAPDGAGRQLNEYTVASFTRVVREMSGERVVPSQVIFAHPLRTPVSGAHREAFCGAELVHGAGFNAVCWPAEALELSPVDRDPALHALLGSHAAREAARRPTLADGPLERIRLALREVLEQGHPELEQVAATLHTSPRTLQRRLSQAGTNWQELLDAERRTRGVSWVQQSERPLSEIAGALGYSDLRAFIRAYKRWTGQTPGEARAR